MTADRSWNDEDLKDWASRIWGAVEYGHDPVREMRAILELWDSTRSDDIRVARDEGYAEAVMVWDDGR